MARILALARLTATGALLMSVCAGSAAPDPHTQVVLAAGADGGNYLRLAKAIQEQATSRNLQITVLTTAGSMENIGLLEAKRADFAFVQSDISRLASLGHRPFSQPLKNLRIVTPLFTEVVQVLVRSDLYVFSTEELRGKVVSFGPKGSGTEGTTRAVLEASGVSINEVNQRDVSLEETDQQLQDETIEVAFLTSAVPTPSVALALREHDARLLLLDGKVIERLAGSGSYVGTAIPRGTYDNQPDEIPTVGVEALLLSRDDYAPETVSLLLQVLRSRRKEIERVAGVQMDLLGSAGPPNSLIPPHEGVKGYLRSDSGSWLPVAAVGLAVSVLVALVLAKRQLVRTLLAHNREVLLALFVLAVVWVLGSGGSSTTNVT